jgi:3-oxoacyl-[acyl-carrier-protein] synthase II
MALPRHRVVVTGLGIVSPVGVGREQFWTRLTQGISGVKEVRDFDTSPFTCHHGGEVQEFDPTRVFPRHKVRQWDRCMQFAMVAAKEALDQAGFGENGVPDADRAGVILGTAAGGRREAIAFQRDVLLADGEMARAMRRFPRRQMLNSSYHAQTNRVASEFGLRGPNLTISTACASGTNAVALGADMIRFGRAGVMLAGGSELLCQIVFTGFAAIRAMSEEGKIRPFDGERGGLMLGEGAGILVLEEREAALARGATILAEIAGWGLSGDALHMTAPAKDGSGLAESIRQSLEDAGLPPEAIDYVNAHGTGTRYNDQMETRAIKLALGEWAQKVPVSSTKSMMGHTLGAAGAIEAVIAVLTIQSGVIPPTINYEHADPECDLDYVPNTARRAPVRTVLSTSAGFAGNNAAILITAPGGPREGFPLWALDSVALAGTPHVESPVA